MKKNLVLLILIGGLFSYNSFSQSLFQEFKALSKPKKCWVLFHPFKAKKAFKVSHEAKRITDSIQKNKIITKGKSGGKLDAFRHSFWMAYLGQNIGVRVARSLGKAHEKENHLFYLENKLEDETLPDKASMDMDLHNNEVGLSFVSRKNKQTKKELIYRVINAIEKGKMVVIKKNKKNQFLSCDNQLIPKDSLKKWENNKCLIPSNSI